MNLQILNVFLLILMQLFVNKIVLNISYCPGFKSKTQKCHIWMTKAKKKQTCKFHKLETLEKIIKIQEGIKFAKYSQRLS